MVGGGGTPPRNHAPPPPPPRLPAPICSSGTDMPAVVQLASAYGRYTGALATTVVRVPAATVATRAVAADGAVGRVTVTVTPGTGSSDAPTLKRSHTVSGVPNASLGSSTGTQRVLLDPAATT